MKKRRPKTISAAAWDAVDNPPVSTEMIGRMRPARLGRPPVGAKAKEQVTLRLDAEVLDRFRAAGAGWQTRINDALRRSAARISKPANRRAAAKKA